MSVSCFVKKNEYHDSVLLMNVTERIRQMAGVREALVVMGTDANKDVLGELGLLTREAETAGKDDLLICLDADEGMAEKLLASFQSLLAPPRTVNQAPSFRTLSAALEANNEISLVQISVPGEFASAVARQALIAGKHVMLFSDNVEIADEVSLKRTGRERGLLVMGPDCGVANINGAALALASVIRPGPIGMIGASGSGLQEAACLVEKLGSGITQAIGTGGRDLKEEVGGLTMLTAIDLLEADPATRVMVLISKPPASEVAKTVLQRVRTCSKPVVIYFLGGDPEPIRQAGAHAAATLDEAALIAVQLSGGRPNSSLKPAERLEAIAEREASRLAPEQRYLRGLFGGGTFSQAAQLAVRPYVGAVNTNAPVGASIRLKDARKSVGHCIVDLGDEEFTRGRAHPVIDPTPYRLRIPHEARDPEVAVLLIDLILGPAAHPDPAGYILQAINEARAAAESRGGYLPVVASVCGSSGDPQGLERQEAALASVGVVVMPSSTQGASLAGMIAGAAGRVHG